MPPKTDRKGLPPSPPARPTERKAPPHRGPLNQHPNWKPEPNVVETNIHPDGGRNLPSFIILPKKK